MKPGKCFGGRWFGAGVTWNDELKGFWINVLTFSLDISHGCQFGSVCTCETDSVQRLVRWVFDDHLEGCPELRRDLLPKTWEIKHPGPTINCAQPRPIRVQDLSRTETTSRDNMYDTYIYSWVASLKDSHGNVILLQYECEK